MKILVVGGGGREHTIAWKLSRSPHVDAIYAAPGNAGIAGMGECVPIGADDNKALLEFAREKKVDLTVVGSPCLGDRRPLPRGGSPDLRFRQ